MMPPSGPPSGPPPGPPPGPPVDLPLGPPPGPPLSPLLGPPPGPADLPEHPIHSRQHQPVGGVTPTQGLQAPLPAQPAGAGPDAITADSLRNLDEGDLATKGNDQLKAAKEAYTKYGQINLAQKAQEATQLFKTACSAKVYDKTTELVSALKAIKLPTDSPTDLSVTIQYPGQPSFSLILPDEKHLNGASAEDITKWYNLTNQAMHMWSSENANEANALATAKTDLDSVVSILKTIQTEIDRRTKEKTGRLSGSQLEVKYQEHVDMGVTISYVGKDELLGHDFGAQSQVPDPTANPQDNGIPAPDDGNID